VFLLDEASFSVTESFSGFVTLFVRCGCVTSVLPSSLDVTLSSHLRLFYREKVEAVLMLRLFTVLASKQAVQLLFAAVAQHTSHSYKPVAFKQWLSC
jgi:hypothetical protein